MCDTLRASEKQTFSYPRTEHTSCCCYVLTGNTFFIITSELVTENIFRLVVQELSKEFTGYVDSTQKYVNTIVCM